MKRILLFFSFCWLAMPGNGHAQETLHTWDVFQVTFTAQETLTNPYMETLQEGKKTYLQAVFTGTEGEAKGKTYTIPGFWDGENQWVVRFAPPSSGTWTYRTISPDAGLNDKNGSLHCKVWSSEEKQENPTRRGFVHVNPEGERAGRYFTYSDGTPFLWIGDTWWNWSKRGVHFESFKKVADDRAEKGFTVGQLFFAGRGWGRQASLLNPDYTSPDIEHIRHIERYIRYANQQGITVWIHGWWGGDKIKESIGGEAIRRWWRYTIHRLHAYNVIWVLAGEYNLHNYGGLDLSFWNDLGRMVKEEDPYTRITSTHPTPPGWGGGAEAPQWSTADVMHNQGWLDYNQSQVGHGEWRNEMTPVVVKQAYQAKPAKPIVVTEPWYEFIEGNPTAKDIRFGAWSAILSGAAGHSYAGGHVWKAHVPEAPNGKDTWPMDLSFETNTLDYPGAKSLAFLAGFLQETQWWKLEPHPEWVIDNPSTYCAADPGNDYVVYLRWGGTVKIDLSSAASSTPFHCRWIDLTQEKVRKERTVNGGGIVSFYPPEDYPGVDKNGDWLLSIRRAK